MLGGAGDRWRFNGHEAHGTLQPQHDPGSGVAATAGWAAAGNEAEEAIDSYSGLPVLSASFGGLEDGSVVSLELRFPGAEHVALFACEFDPKDSQKLKLGEEVVVVCTSREQARQVGLSHEPIALDAARFECG